MIRLLRREDIPICIEIFNKSIESKPYDIKRELEEQYKDTLIKPEIYVFEENGIIKGFGGLANCRFDDQVYSLGLGYVLPEYQGQGIGKALVKHRIQRIKELGGVIIFSTTGKPRHLERFGFIKIDAPYTDWHLMQLVIK